MDTAIPPSHHHVVLSSFPRPPNSLPRQSQSTSAPQDRTSLTSPTSPLRRKPLPQNISPLALRAASGEHWATALRQREEERDSQDQSSLDALVAAASRNDVAPPRGARKEPTVASDRDTDKFSEVDLWSNAEVSGFGSGDPVDHNSTPRAPSGSEVNGVQSGHQVQRDGIAEIAPSVQPINAMLSQPIPKSRNLEIQLDGHTRDASYGSDESYDSIRTSKPRSPNSKLTSLFPWKSSPPVPASSTTSFSSKTPSSSGSPRLSPTFMSLNKSHPSGIHVRNPYEDDRRALPGSPSNQPPPDPLKFGRVDEMEQDLRDISSELASSIRREIDLEDLVDRLQLEASNGAGHNRRTSDYFSDAGMSFAKFSIGDSESRELEVEKQLRKAEQEKAQLRLRLTQKAQDERIWRKGLEQQVLQLQEMLDKSDQGRASSGDDTARVRDLEASLEETRRRLSEERTMKENYEDLLTALRANIEEHRDERDNLRDEVVPQLQARVEGLESDAAELQRLTYEHTEIQQELQSLRTENAALINARKLEAQMQQQTVSDSIAEEGETFREHRLTRSNSVTRGSMRGRSKPGSLTRSYSLKERESGESLVERVKDIEMQRDALHRALKSLLERQEYQTREAQRTIKALEMERDRALAGNGRKGYHWEVSNLREEINHLRRRADEALEQKWQCEKGLSGLKMDLDRAEQETSSLRALLQEHEILIPESTSTSDSDSQKDGPGTTSLEKVYKELQTTHALALARIQQLQSQSHGPGSPSDATSAAADMTIELLKKSISDAEAERDYAQRQAEEYRLQAESYQAAGKGHIEEEQSLAGQLRASAERVEELAAQVRQQLESNSLLRQRLSEAITRGESQQKSSAARITELQGKLKSLEERLTAAQQHSEERIIRHEEEVREIRESHNAQLQRMKSGFASTAKLSPGPPRSPLFTTRSPRLSMTTTGLGMSISEALKTEFLEKRVEDLEKALSDADREMEEVVSRMNFAQIEVMELQSERDDAIRQTRKLQAEFNLERQKVKALIV